MNFTGDESLEARLIGVLRREGHLVTAIHEQNPGMADSDVLALSVANDAPVITNDKDFGDLVFRQRLPTVGVVFLRFPVMPTLEKAEILAEWLRRNPKLVRDHYVVLAAGTARVRRMDSWPPR